MAAAVLFSIKPIMVKLVYASAGQGAATVEPITVMAGRLVFSLPLFVLIALWSNRPGQARMAAGDWARVGVLALIGYYFSQLLDVTALAHIPAGLERIVLFAYPTLVVLISALTFGTPVRRTALLALGLTWAGVALAVSAHVDLSQFGFGRPGFSQFGLDPSGPDPSASARADTAFGVALVLGAAFTFAVYSVGSASMIGKLGATRFTALAMCGSSAAVGLHYELSGAASPLAMPTPALLWCAAMALFATLLPAFLFSAGVARVGASRAAILSSVGPVATIGLDAILLGEPLHAPQLIGAALVVAGVTLVGRGGRTAH